MREEFGTLQLRFHRDNATARQFSGGCSGAVPLWDRLKRVGNAEIWRVSATCLPGRAIPIAAVEDTTL
jgi:hypothetical protein